jgi:hypothetical protein
VISRVEVEHRSAEHQEVQDQVQQELTEHQTGRVQDQVEHQKCRIVGTSGSAGSSWDNR